MFEGALNNNDIFAVIQPKPTVILFKIGLWCSIIVEDKDKDSFIVRRF